MREAERAETIENESETVSSQNEPTRSSWAASCPDCNKPFKTSQGLAGHWRLAHSDSTRRALDEHRRVLDQQSAELKRREEAARRAQAEATRRERAAREVEATPESERVGRIVAREIASLPEVTEDTILRVNGRDYCIEGGRLSHLYFPDGEKTEFEDGQWFQFEGRAHCVRDGKLRAVPASEILADLLEEGE